MPVELAVVGTRPGLSLHDWIDSSSGMLGAETGPNPSGSIVTKRTRRVLA
jgi:hypothetical protein